MLGKIQDNIEKEKNIKEQREKEIAERIRELSDIRQAELENIKTKRIFLNGLVEESNIVLERFHRSIEDR